MLKILNIPYKITKNIPIFNSSNLNPIKNPQIIQKPNMFTKMGYLTKSLSVGTIMV